MIERAMRTARTVSSASGGDDRKLKLIAGGRRRIGRGDVNVSLALRAHRMGIKRHTRLPRYPRPSRTGLGQHGDPAQHQVWCLEALARAHESADRRAWHRQQLPCRNSA